MAWSLVDNGSAQASAVGVSPLTLTIPVPAAPADGDVLIIGVRAHIYQNRDPYEAPVGSVALSSMAGQGLSASTSTATFYNTNNTDSFKTIKVFGFQIDDATLHTGPNYTLTLTWTSASGFPAANDYAYLLAGWGLYRSGVNPTWPVDWTDATGVNGRVSWLASAINSDAVAAVGHGAADGFVFTVQTPLWTEAWVEEVTVDGSLMHGIGQSFSVTPTSTNMDWETNGGYGISGGADGGGFVRGGGVTSWYSYDPDNPPIEVAAIPDNCLLHIPHHRWLEGGNIRQVEQNWHEFESWSARFLTNNDCRPCASAGPL